MIQYQVISLVYKKREVSRTVLLKFFRSLVEASAVFGSRKIFRFILKIFLINFLMIAFQNYLLYIFEIRTKIFKKQFDELVLF